MTAKIGVLAFFITGLVIGGIAFVVASGAAAPTAQESAPTIEEPAGYLLDGTYADLTRGQMITQSDAIFVGEVKDMPQAQWNQDSGEYWGDEQSFPLLYHDIEVQIVESIVDTLGLDDTVTVTVLGNSPSGSIDSGPEIVSESMHTLQPGEQYVFFIVESYMAWQENPTSPESTRPILRFITGPSVSYLTKADNGTETDRTIDETTLFTAEHSNEEPLSIEDIQRLREFPEPTPTIVATDNQ